MENLCLKRRRNAANEVFSNPFSDAEKEMDVRGR